MATNEFIENIKADLVKSGFPLQLSVAQSLQQSGFSPLYSQYFLDLDESKGREIDVIGQSRWLVINGRTFYSMNLSANVVIECKASDQRPWVFYTVPTTPSVRLLHNSLIIAAKPDIFKTKGRYLGLVRLQRFLTEHHHQSGVTEIAVAFQEPFGNRDRGATYQSLLQASKASESRNSLSLDTMGNQSVALNFPIVVFSGQVFQANVEGGDLTIIPTDHLVCQLAYRSLRYDRTYLVDVVTPEYLPLLLARIRDSVEALAQMIARAPHAATTVQLFGLTPRKGVNRKGRIKKAGEDGIRVVIGNGDS